MLIGNSIMAEVFQVVMNDDANNSATTKTFNISDGTISEVTLFTGRGNPESKWHVEENIIDHGGFPTRVKIKPRRIRLGLLWKVDSANDAVARREKIGEIFRPWLIGSDNFTQKASLKVTREDSSVRQIDFIVEKITDMPLNAGDDFPGEISGLVDVELLCPDPMWYDPTAISLDDGGSPSFTTWTPLDVSASSADMWPVVTVVGPAASFRFDLYGVGSSRSIIFNSSPAIGGSETITIDTRPFRRKIVDQTGADRTDLVLVFTGLETMRIYSSLDTSNIQYASASCSSTTGVTDVSWTYHKRYITI